MKHLFKYILLLSLTLSQTLYAQTDEEYIKALMVNKTEIFFLIMNDKNNDKKIRQEKIMAEVNPLFDFKLMARLSLHKNTWKSLTKEQKKNLLETFYFSSKGFLS
ncbi:ABC transporter substrate-binding protein [Sulfurimonas sp. MAG313]|nr:ABC transporter substrate-binding protein [Sulfurimonas sp. MAG313]MDF1881973.1 ABC transporter substrate-binding protein [Sulfurimonas sp. MAG313]